MIILPDQGILLDGHDVTRSGALDTARQALLDVGADAFDVDIILVDRPGLVARAWWGGTAVGFVGDGHPDAQPVTIVHATHPALTS